jgi:hypothetical protein
MGYVQGHNQPYTILENMLKTDQASYQQFRMEELMGEGGSIHNLCRLADKKKQLKTGEFHDVTLPILMFHGAAFDRSW